MIEMPDGTFITNFDKEEFACKCGCGEGIEEMNEEFLESLDCARDEAAVPFIITSAFRCKEHNKAIGSKSSSSHLEGLAVDIAALNNFSRYKIINGLLYAGFDRMGISMNFIHTDTDPSKTKERIWAYGR